jgi:hypothetical protein
MARKPNTIKTPGEDTQSGAGESDVDAAIAAGQAGKAHKIAKAKPKVPASKVKGDPERPAQAAVNAKKDMTYEAAMKRHAATVEMFDLLDQGPPRDAEGAKKHAERVAELQKVAMQRSILTEKGWVAMPNRRPPQRIA